MTIHVLKLGGGAGIDGENALHDLATRIQAGETWVVVHGASAAANALAEQTGHPVQMLTSPEGHTSRYTDARMIELYSAAAASVNQRIAARLESLGVRAAGLSGPNIVHAERKKAIRAVRNGRIVVVRDDYSGSITGVDSRTVCALLHAGLTPVIAPVAMGEEFERLNVDGDLVAAALAADLGADTLVILSNVPGLLRDLNDINSLIPQFSLHDMDSFEPLAQGRMKKKLIAAQRANAACVILGDARIENPLDAALNGGGTHILNGAHYVAQYVA